MFIMWFVSSRKKKYVKYIVSYKNEKKRYYCKVKKERYKIYM